MKILDGKKLAEFIKERQYKVVKEMSKKPKLLIIRDSDNPVIMKYVAMKKAYGRDIGVEVEEYLANNSKEIETKIKKANQDATVTGIIIQLPIREKEKTEEIVSLIATEKDVDGLKGQREAISATARAIDWLLAGYDIDIKRKKLAIVGRGRLVGTPLYKMWRETGLDVSLFHRGDDLAKLKDYGVVVTATGQPRLIKSEMIMRGAVVVDAGTASEKGVLVGDIDEEIRERKDLKAITPRIGGVGPLTVACLFEQVIAMKKR